MIAKGRSFPTFASAVRQGDGASSLWRRRQLGRQECRHCRDRRSTRLGSRIFVGEVKINPASRQPSRTPLSNDRRSKPPIPLCTREVVGSVLIQLNSAQNNDCRCRPPGVAPTTAIVAAWHAVMAARLFSKFPGPLCEMPHSNVTAQ